MRRATFVLIGEGGVDLCWVSGNSPYEAYEALVVERYLNGGSDGGNGDISSGDNSICGGGGDGDAAL